MGDYDGFAAEVEELAANDEHYMDALRTVATAQALRSILDRMCATRSRTPTLRMALDEAARMRYEHGGEMKRAVTMDGAKIADYTACLTAGSPEKVVDRLEITDADAFTAYCMADRDVLMRLVRSNLEEIAAEYLSEGVLPNGCEKKQVTVPAEPQIFKNMLLKVYPERLPSLSEEFGKLLGDGGIA